MPTVEVNGTRLFYEDTERGAEAVVFAHGLAWDHRMYDAQIAALRDGYRCVAFDFRGHGQSQATESGYDMDTLAEDAAALIRALAIAPVHFVGLSMGGFVGMRLGIHHPELLRSLVLLDTSADPEAFLNRIRYRMLIFLARRWGLGIVAGQVMRVMFGSGFLRDEQRAEERDLWRQRMVANDRIMIARAATAVIEREGVIQRLGEIRAPTLVAVGTQDRATPPEKSARIHARIPGSRMQIIPGAGHMSTVEQPDRVSEVLAEFLDSVEELKTSSAG